MMHPSVDPVGKLGLRNDDFGPLRLLLESAYEWLKLKLFDDARLMFEALEILAPDDPAPLLGLARVHFESGSDEACEFALTAVESRGNNIPATIAEAALHRGRLKHRAGDGKAARAHYERAIEFDVDGILTDFVRDDLLRALDIVDEAMTRERERLSPMEVGDEWY